MDYPHIHPNNAAFPVPHGAETGGISIREYYAGMMMQSLVSSIKDLSDKGYKQDEVMLIISTASVALSDALIAALNKNPVP